MEEPTRTQRSTRRRRDPSVAPTEYPLKATHAQTRAHNASLVLRALYDLGPISRADIARLTGLTRTSVGELVADLERTASPATSAAARAPVASSPPSSRSTTTRARSSSSTSASGPFTGRPREPPRRPHHEAHPRPRRSRRRRRRATSSTSSSTTSAPRPRATILGIGVGTPGIVDASGTIRWAVDLDWTDLPLAQLIQDRHGLPDGRRQRQPCRGARDLPVPRRRPAAQHRRDQGRARHRRRADPRRPAVQRRRRRRRRDRPRRRRARRRAVPLRPVRLPRDGRQRDRRRQRGRAREGLDVETIDDVAAAIERGDERADHHGPRRRPADRRGHRQPDRRSRRPPDHGPRHGDPPRRAVVRRPSATRPADAASGRSRARRASSMAVSATTARSSARAPCCSPASSA